MKMAKDVAPPQKKGEKRKIFFYKDEDGKRCGQRCGHNSWKMARSSKKHPPAIMISISAAWGSSSSLKNKFTSPAMLPVKINIMLKICLFENLKNTKIHHIQKWPWITGSAFKYNTYTSLSILEICIWRELLVSFENKPSAIYSS